MTLKMAEIASLAPNRAQLYGVSFLLNFCVIPFNSSAEKKMLRSRSRFFKWGILESKIIVLGEKEKVSDIGGDLEKFSLH